MKKQITIQLRGVVRTPDGGMTQAMTHEADQVTGFVGDSPVDAKGAYISCYFEVDNSMTCFPVLTTPKGEYTLTKHANLNIYQGVINGVKVRLTLKKVVGTLTYWA